MDQKKYFVAYFYFIQLCNMAVIGAGLLARRSRGRENHIYATKPVYLHP